MKKLLLIAFELVLCVAFGAMLFVYAVPMEDLSLDLSLALADGTSAEEFDDKGWTVFTQTGDTVTVLEPNGFGGYSGLELGQTFYFSRQMEEDLDDPTLQLDALNRNFSVFLDGELIYTDCPEQDNRIGWLCLPMSQWERTEALTISLPSSYRGKVLTIAQSSPPHTEAASVMAFPCAVRLFCGYAYESGLIAQSFRTAFLCLTLFLIGVLLLAFVRKGNSGTLFAALTAFLWMAHVLTRTGFFLIYFGDRWSWITAMPQYLLALLLLLVLSVQAGKGKRPMLLLAAACGVSVLVAFILELRAGIAPFTLEAFLTGPLTQWIAAAGLLAALTMGALFWRKENSFYRLFTPLALAAEVLYWVYSLTVEKNVGQQLLLSLKGGQITYVYFRLLFPLMAAALVTVLTEAIQSSRKDRTDKRLMEQRQEVVLAGYESLRRHQREVMMLRHDMMHHFRVLQEMSHDPQVSDYLTSLIGQDKKIRPVIQSGNEMLDIILNGGLSAALDAGVQVEVVKAEAPARIPMQDADQCSLFMNILGNAVTAVSEPGLKDPYIRLDIHVKNGYFMFICENTASDAPQVAEKEETVPKHGLGLKIVRDIVERYGGLADTERLQGHYRVRVAIPLDQSDR